MVWRIIQDDIYQSPRLTRVTTSTKPPPFCSIYIENQVFFGGYPSMKWYTALCDYGISMFVDLTTSEERNRFSFVYHHPNMIRFPIPDNSVPRDKVAFCRFLQQLAFQILQHPSEKIYIHCKGGHGRSALVIAALLCFVENYSPQKALDITKILHSERPLLKLKYRYKKCPDNPNQRLYLSELFSLFSISSLIPTSRRISIHECLSQIGMRPLGLPYKQWTFIGIVVSFFRLKCMSAFSTHTLVGEDLRLASPLREKPS